MIASGRLDRRGSSDACARIRGSGVCRQCTALRYGGAERNALRASRSLPPESGHVRQGDERIADPDIASRSRPPGTRALRIGEDAAPVAAVIGVAPERLHRERVVGGGEGHLRRGALAARDPGALVTVLGAARVEPAGAGELVRDRLARLMPLDDGDAGISPEPVEVSATAGTRVGDVRQVRVGDVADGRRRRAVVGAVLPAESGRVVAVGGGDHVLDAGVARCGRIPEVLSGPHRLGRELGLFRAARCRRRVVVPRAGRGQDALRVSSRRPGAVAERGPGRYVLAVLGDAVEPRAVAYAAQELLEDSGLTGRVVTPL